jgi:hypothetical protein
VWVRSRLSADHERRAVFFYAITVIGATGPATVVTRLGRVTKSF